MKVGLAAKPESKRAIALARKAIDHLGDRVDLVVAEETHQALGRTSGAVAPLEGLEADALVSVGGDGTFLYALQRTGAPLLPINAGTVGFLAEVNGSDDAAFRTALDRLVAGEYLLEERMKLACEWQGKNLPDATNEIVLHTDQVAKMRLFEIDVDGRPIGRIRADGILLATPTGSTSYSLSALGPIVDPALDAIVVTALAPFETTQRAVVIDPLRTVSVRPVLPGKGCIAVVDGQSEFRIPGGEGLLAYRSPRRATFVRLGAPFFERLRGRRVLPWGDPGIGREADGDADLPPTA